MSNFSVGYAEVNINPKLGIGISGYYISRLAKGFLDDLQASCLALSLNDSTVLIINVDQMGIMPDGAAKYRHAIAKGTGICFDNIFVTCTHTHTAPLPDTELFIYGNEQDILEYGEFLGERLIDAAKLAIADLKPGRMGYATGYAPERVAYIRRYHMKDGSTMTCPPVNDPNIEGPIGTLDQRVHVLRFDRETGKSIVLVNYGVHCDTIGGELLSADFPAWMRSTLDKALDGVKCMFFPGAQGDVGSTNVHPSGGDMNDTEISFDNEMKSPGMARFVGRALAGTVLQVYDKVSYVDVNELNVLHKTARIPSNMPDRADLPLAHKYKDLHEAGKDEEIPYTAMELTTVVAEALRMCRLEHGPEYFDLPLISVQIGPIALLGIPGEPFTEIGVKIKETPGWDMILPCGLTNGYFGYFPIKSAYDEGGYEARTSQYKSGVAELLIETAKSLLTELKHR